jgi:hypothetical protein
VDNAIKWFLDVTYPGALDANQITLIETDNNTGRAIRYWNRPEVPMSAATILAAMADPANAVYTTRKAQAREAVNAMIFEAQSALVEMSKRVIYRLKQDVAVNGTSSYAFKIAQREWDAHAQLMTERGESKSVVELGDVLPVDVTDISELIGTYAANQSIFVDAVAECEYWRTLYRGRIGDIALVADADGYYHQQLETDIAAIEATVANHLTVDLPQVITASIAALS